MVEILIYSIIVFLSVWFSDSTFVLPSNRSDLVKSITCYTACIPLHFGCLCEETCQCESSHQDCGDGPYGTGACTCQYGKWKFCGVPNPLVPVEFNHIHENVKPKTLTFDNEAIFRVLPLSKITSKSPAQIHDGLATNTLPQPFKKSNLLYVDTDLVQKLMLDISSTATLENLKNGLAGLSLFPGSEPFAASYGGHQFSQYSGQLGDGRVVNLGQLHHKFHGELAKFEVALKGAGRTPFSRAGDGRSTLKSSLRELTGSVYLQSIGIPTVQVLAVTESCDDKLLYRDTWYNSTIDKYIPGIVARLSPSFLRFGTVQIAAKRFGLSGVIPIAKEALRVMKNLNADNHYSGVSNSDACYAWNLLSTTEILACLLANVSTRLAMLVASWMSSGFVHGVMNTDNMSLVGLTLDLNVFGWITNWNESYTPNYIDTEGRYAFGRQPEVALWNLKRLADALTGTRYVSDSEHDASNWVRKNEQWLPKSEAASIVDKFLSTYRNIFNDMMKNRLGLVDAQGSDVENIIEKFLQVAKHADYHILSRRVFRLQLEVSDESSFQTWLEKTVSVSGLGAYHHKNLEEVVESIRRLQKNGVRSPRNAVPNIIFRSGVIDKALSQLTRVDENHRCHVKKRQAYLQDLIQLLRHPFDYNAKNGRKVLERLSIDLSSLPYQEDSFLSSCGAQ